MGHTASPMVITSQFAIPTSGSLSGMSPIVSTPIPHLRSSPTLSMDPYRFSILQYASKNTDPMQGFSHILQSKRESYTDWTHNYQHGLNFLFTCRNDDPLLPEHRKEVEEIKAIIDRLDHEILELQSALKVDRGATIDVPSASSQLQSLSTTSSNKNKKLSLDNSCPYFGKPDHGKSYPYKLESDPFKFLDRFHSHCSS
ncbi:hypothetical protein FBU30_005976, partial [Linnemannia zychae]